MSCLICRDESPQLNRICYCLDALICSDCLALSHNSMNKCPLCRKFLKFNYKRNWGYYMYLLLIEFFGIFFNIFIGLLYPTIVILKDNSTENYIVYGLALYFVLIIDPAISLLFSSSLNIKLLYYQIIKCLSISIMSLILLVITNNYTMSLYVIGILAPFYIFPTLIYGINCLIKQFKKIDNYNTQKTLTKKIQLINDPFIQQVTTQL